MTIRAVDMQIVVQKSSEVAQNRYARDSKTRLQLQQQAQGLQQRNQIENRQIKDMQKTEKTTIHKDSDNKEKKSKKDHKKQDSKKNKKKKAPINSQSCRIDIKI